MEIHHPTHCYCQSNCSGWTLHRRSLLCELKTWYYCNIPSWARQRRLEWVLLRNERVHVHRFAIADYTGVVGKTRWTWWVIMISRSAVLFQSPPLMLLSLFAHVQMTTWSRTDCRRKFIAWSLLRLTYREPSKVIFGVIAVRPQHVNSPSRRGILNSCSVWSG
jgi:hypothetical protein